MKLLILLDTSPSVDGGALHLARSVAGLIVKSLPPGSVGVAGFCSRVREARGGDPLSLRVCSGTNLEAALRYAVDVAGNYDAIVMLTDARPTVGSKRLGRLERLASELESRLVIAGIGDYNRDIAGRLASASGGISLRLPEREWEAASLVLVASGAYEWWVLDVAVAHPPWLSVIAPEAREGLPGWSFIPVPPKPPASGIPLLIASREGWEPLLRGSFSLPILAGLVFSEGRALAKRWKPLGMVEVRIDGNNGLEGIKEVMGVM